MALSISSLPLLLIFLVALSATTSHAQVPANETFQYVNQGEFGEFMTEYDATYRITPLYGSPFQLMWYNTTPGQYYVGLRMGLSRSESILRWVWDANRGHPVGENATLTFGRDGNLVLAEADGRVAWQTGTANKGVVRLRILSTGNIVLIDKKGRFVWQSFDFPTDTLLVTQSLRVAGPSKLISRRSAADNSDGIYSFVLDPNGFNLYANIGGKRLRYSTGRFAGHFGNLSKATLETSPDAGTATELRLTLDIGGRFIVTRPKYDATLSFLRVEPDGNLVAYTYYDPVDYSAWERTYALFDGDMSGCSLPAKCGSLGVCKNEMCVACPTPKGLLGWSESCAPPALGGCKTGSSVDYYKLTRVEQFIPKFNKGEGKVKVEECKRRCTADCKCLGIFYWEYTSECWLASTLGTLEQGLDDTHVAYIKYAK